MSEGARAGLWEGKDNGGEGSVEEEDHGDPDVADDLESAPEVPQNSNITLSSQPLVSPAKTNFLKKMEQITQLMGKLTQAVSPATIPKPLHSRLHQ
ncbi:hypothetical protein O181_003320 [Austropuccinia psidii MF-1]|uniref:Uncharacterized protein n=1 Tax=Austropuccinia psidii MF-1 TaxID=1389203 RepID=A0A9Q3BET2_9BASI|nr:hypothetical protein [Austropuccinia psidii MF-1]